MNCVCLAALQGLVFLKCDDDEMLGRRRWIEDMSCVLHSKFLRLFSFAAVIRSHVTLSIRDQVCMKIMIIWRWEQCFGYHVTIIAMQCQACWCVSLGRDWISLLLTFVCDLYFVNFCCKWCSLLAKWLALFDWWTLRILSPLFYTKIH